MRLKLKTAPSVEPFTLDEAKLQLRVEVTTDDALITSLIKVARQMAESEMHRAFLTQTWQMYLDTESAEIEIPKPPLQSIVSIKAISTVETTVDENTDKDQPVLLVASTTGFAAGDSVMVNRDGAREEDLVILSIQTDVSLTMTTNLKNVHMAAEADKVEKYTPAAASLYYVDTSEDSPGRVKLKSGCVWPTHRNFASFIVEFKAGYGDTAAEVPDKLKQGILQLIGYLYKNREAAEIPKEIKAMFSTYKIWRI